MAIAPISLTKRLVFPDEAALPRIGLALSRAYLPEAGVRDLLSLARSKRLVKA